MTLNDEGLQFIKSKEGLRLYSYQDSAGVWTIGYGTTRYKDGAKVGPGQVITEEMATLTLARDIKMRCETLQSSLQEISLNQHQYNALISFAYNAGVSALLNSSILKRVRADPGDPTIRNAFMMWTKITRNGKIEILRGLVVRRAEEANLYFKKD